MTTMHEIQVEGHQTESRKTLANENFVSKVPPAVVNRERAKLDDLESQAEKIQDRLGVLD